jgi:hypothetical protein
MPKIKKRYRNKKADREAAKHKEYLAITREIDDLVRAIAEEIVEESITTVTEQVNDQLDMEDTPTDTPIVVVPTITYVDNAKPSLGRYKGVGSLPPGCQSCGANHKPIVQ